MRDNEEMTFLTPVAVGKRKNYFITIGLHSKRMSANNQENLPPATF